MIIPMVNNSIFNIDPNSVSDTLNVYDSSNRRWQGIKFVNLMMDGSSMNND